MSGKCVADICMDGCYGDYMLYIPGGQAKHPAFFRGIGRLSAKPSLRPADDADLASTTRGGSSKART